MFSTMRDEVALGKCGALAMKYESKRAAQARSEGGLVRRLRVWKARRAVAAELYQMDERALSDIGLSYGDIPKVLQTVC